jgi:NADH:ubiquinone oxidoreductase subunit 6 (subunit J)
MDYQTGFFYLFSAVLLFAAYRVITARNPVHAVLYLMLAFSQAAALWLLLKAEFLGLTLVLVYLGAVMVLFLFVVMMLDIKLDGDRWGFWQNFPLAATLGALVAAELIAVLWVGFPNLTGRPCAGACRGRSVEHQGAGQAAVHRVPLPGRGGGRHPAGGHDRRHCADAAPAQGQQGHRPGLQVRVRASRPPGGGAHGRHPKGRRRCGPSRGGQGMRA